MSTFRIQYLKKVQFTKKEYKTQYIHSCFTSIIPLALKILHMLLLCKLIGHIKHLYPSFQFLNSKHLIRHSQVPSCNIARNVCRYKIGKRQVKLDFYYSNGEPLCIKG